MRSATLGEIGLLARVLMTLPPDRRWSAARQIVAEVKTAETHLRLTGRCHPAFGDGSLMSRCLSLSPSAEPLASDRDFLSSVIIACREIGQHSRS